MIFNKLYSSDNHYIVVYDNNKFVKISYKNNEIIAHYVSHINTNILEEMAEAFTLYQFPFKFVKVPNGILLDFFHLLNSDIFFYIVNGKLKCDIKIDDKIRRSYSVKNDTNFIKVYLGNVIDIDPLTHVENIKIFNHKDKGYPYVLIVMPPYMMPRILYMAKQYRWSFIPKQNFE